MFNLRDFNIMQNQVGHGKQIRKRLFLPTVDRCLQSFKFFNCFCAADMCNGTCKESAGAASRVKNNFTEFRINFFHNKVGYRAGCIEFSGTTCALQILEHAFVKLVKSMLLRCINKINFLIDTVNKLTEIDTGLHVVVDIIKHITNDKFAHIAVGRIQFFELVKKFIDKLD